MTMQEDLAHRASEIHWPAGFDPAKADLFSHNELLIDASCERVWQHIGRDQVAAMVSEFEGCPDHRRHGAGPEHYLPMDDVRPAARK
jgi:hypothetical protein